MPLVPVEEYKGLIIHVASDELNEDWLRSARLDPEDPEFKKKDGAEMIEEV